MCSGVGWAAAPTHSHDRAGPQHNPATAQSLIPRLILRAAGAHPLLPPHPKGTFVPQQRETGWGAAEWLWGWHSLLHCVSLLLPQPGLGTQLLSSRVAVRQCRGDNGPTVVTVLDHYACSIQRWGKARVPGLSLGNLRAAPSCREKKGIP